MLAIEKLVNQVVVHKSFGKGIIRSVDEKHLEVEFIEKNKISKFAYPSCFRGFLLLENHELQSEIQAVVETWEVESGTIQKEELKHQYEKTMQGIKARQIAAKEKKLKAAQRAMEQRLNHN